MIACDSKKSLLSFSSSSLIISIFFFFTTGFSCKDDFCGFEPGTGGPRAVRDSSLSLF